MANSPFLLAQNHFNGSPAQDCSPITPEALQTLFPRLPETGSRDGRTNLFDRIIPGSDTDKIRLDTTFPFLGTGGPCYSKPTGLLAPYSRSPQFSEYPWNFNPYLPGAFSLNNPKLPTGAMYPPHFYPNPLQTSLSQLPSPFSSLLPGVEGLEQSTLRGQTPASIGGALARLCQPPYPAGLPLGRGVELVHGSGEREAPHTPGSGVGGVQSPVPRGVKEDPGSDSELEITDLSECSSDNENDSCDFRGDQNKSLSSLAILEGKTALHGPSVVAPTPPHKLLGCVPPTARLAIGLPGTEKLQMTAADCSRDTNSSTVKS